MALNFGTASTALHPRPLISSKISKQKIGLKLYDTPSPSCLKAATALSEGTESKVTEEDPPTYSGKFAGIFLMKFYRMYYELGLWILFGNLKFLVSQNMI